MLRALSEQQFVQGLAPENEDGANSTEAAGVSAEVPLRQVCEPEHGPVDGPAAEAEGPDGGVQVLARVRRELVPLPRGADEDASDKPELERNQARLLVGLSLSGF